MVISDKLRHEAVKSTGGKEQFARLAQVAMQAGATKEEIVEALRGVQYVGGVNGVFTAYLAL